MRFLVEWRLFLLVGVGALAGVWVADERATVVLAVDTSLSMEADDVDPDRLAVARQAAREFVADLPGELNVGLVTFHGATAVAAAPSRDRAALIAAIDAMELGEGTAIGEAIFSSLDAIAAEPRGEDDGPAPARIVVMSDGETTVSRANEDVSGWFVGAGIALLAVAASLSLLWFQRLP